MMNRQPRAKKRAPAQPPQDSHSQTALPNREFAQEEDMPIHRYTIPRPECRRELWLRELRELNLILDYQNKILVEILAALEERNGST